MQNKSEDEVCLPSNTSVAEAQSACRKQEVHIDLKEDHVLVSVMIVMTVMISMTMSLISYMYCGGDGSDDVSFWLFLAGDHESAVEPKAVRYSTRSTRGVYHDPFRGVYHDPGEVRQTFCSFSEMVDVSIE